MSLVVARCMGDTIGMVADTFISWPVGSPQEQQNRRPYENAMPKIVIARRDLAVGVAGDDAVQFVKEIVQARESPVAEMITMLAGLRGEFVVASLDPEPRLRQIRGEQVHEDPSMAWAWAGDEDAYGLFRTQRLDMERLGPGGPNPLMASMQWLVNVANLPTVGGFMTRLVTTVDGFQFVGDAASVFLPLAIAGDGSPIPHADELHSSYQIVPGVGRGSTFGATAYWIPQSRTVWLFRHEAPWEAETYTARTAHEVVEGAATRSHEVAMPLPGTYSAAPI